MQSLSKIFLTAMMVAAVLTSCTTYTPKPRGYFRIELAPKSYDTAHIKEPVEFEYPSNVALIVQKKGEEDFFDIVYPTHNARIYCSYKNIDNNFYEISEDSRNFVYKHVIKADAISEQPFENPEKKMYGILYQIKGNAASQVQFLLTDSVKHFLRGALYFNNRPNKDSIAPVADYLTEDIVRLMETAEWVK
ncbi:MAG: gliding motility lipoprotein GldD [Paludibacteraceae bacterium]|nr:gliding motility lipoprotein GldD [Paludibacteraceae bacterium]